MGLDLIKTFGALAFVIGLIFVLAWTYKRYLPAGQIGAKEQDGWRLLGTRALGPGRQIFVLEVGRKLLIVGAAEKSLTQLMIVDDETDRKQITDALSSKPSPSFAELLKRSKPQ